MWSGQLCSLRLFKELDAWWKMKKARCTKRAVAEDLERETFQSSLNRSRSMRRHSNANPLQIQMLHDELQFRSTKYIHNTLQNVSSIMIFVYQLYRMYHIYWSLSCIWMKKLTVMKSQWYHHKWKVASQVKKKRKSARKYMYYVYTYKEHLNCAASIWNTFSLISLSSLYFFWGNLLSISVLW